MKPERWKRIDDLVQAALDRSGAERAAFVDKACAGDDLLRREVESVLAYQQGASGFLESPAEEQAAELIAGFEAHSLEGQTISHYKLIQKIGAGGMGEVYLAEDTSLKRQVAIKFLPPDSTEDQLARKRLIREAQAAARLDHPNICSIHEVGEEGNLSFIVMHYIEGETLSARIKRSPVEITQAIDIGAQMADALAEAHSHGIIHRDIKPQNIMITARNQARVMDFGLAKVIQDRSSAESQAVTESLLTEPSAIVGTIPYMSPEQVQGEVLDARSDIFSFGAVLYEMVSGHRPFEAENAAALISAILSREPISLSRYTANVPAELERIARKCLEKNRERRYQTMRDVAIDLENLRSEHASARVKATREELPTASLHAAVTDQGLRRSSIFTSRRALVFYSLAAMLVVAAVMYALLFRGLPATKQPEIKSLAVLPLDSFSSDPAQDYLADGMTEALIAELSKIGSLRVISRTSVMQYKGARKALPEIARELEVDAIVEGSVQRSGDKIGITAQLIRAATDQHLWANQYERDLRDVLSLQREVARAIASEISVKLTPTEQALLAEARPVSAEANDAYLKGLYYRNQGINEYSGETLRKSFEYFEQAIRIEPNYAQAYAGLGAAYHWYASGHDQEFYAKAKAVLVKALQLDDTLAEAHSSLAFTIHRLDWDWSGAEREYKRALELSPNFAGAHHGYALYLSSAGRHEEAIREINKAEALNPVALSVKINVAYIYLFARQYGKAIEEFRSTLELSPNRSDIHLSLGQAYLYNGMQDEGVAEIKRAIDLLEKGGQRFTPGKALLAWAYAMLGNRSEAIKILDEILKSSGEPASKVEIAAVHNALGDRDQAFAWLERAYQGRDQGLLYINVYPTFDSLRSDPRYHDLLRRIGLPE